MGAFHALYIFIFVIDERFGAARLRDLCIAAPLIGVIGEQYDKEFHAFKTICEAVQRLKVKSVKRWLCEEIKEDILED